MRLDELRDEAQGCRACDLWRHEGLAAAGIDRSAVYVTNTVKHFKWERGGKSARRIHKKPNATEIAACRPSPLASVVLATAHPSSILRAPDPDARRVAEQEFFADLAVVATHLTTHRAHR